MHSPSSLWEKWQGELPLAEAMAAIHRSLSSIQSCESTPVTSGWNTDRAPRGEVKVMLGPAPHVFRSQLDHLHANPSYTAKLQERYRILQNNRVPIVFSLMHFSVLAGVQWNELRAVVRRQHPGSDYRVYPKQKRSGGLRWISIPTPQLHAAQTWIAQNILRSPGVQAQVHRASTAYSEGSSILANAQPHAGAPWLLKIDIQSFFESVSERQVYWVFRRLGYSALLSFEMARICTRVIPPTPDKERRRDHQKRWQEKLTIMDEGPYPSAPIGHLPQGAPTSPMLSNLVMAGIDDQIQAIADASGAIYTRYADDLVLSFTNGPVKRLEHILRAIRKVLGDSGFTINRKKTRVLGPGARKVVTGLLVDSPEPRLPRDLKAHLETALYHMENRGIANCSNWEGSKHPLAYLDHIAGLVQFAYSIEPDYAQRLFGRLRLIVGKEPELMNLLTQFGPDGKTTLTKTAHKPR